MPAKSALLIYPHQLFTDIFSLSKETLLIFIEDDLFFRQFPFHKQKLILHRAAMTIFKETLVNKGFSIKYIESSETTPSMQQLKNFLQLKKITEVSYYELVDNWLEKRLTTLLYELDISVSRHNSPGFLTTRGLIDDFFENNPNRMQKFYEWQRKRLRILIEENGKPTGGKWSYDVSNRRKLPKTMQVPQPYTLEKIPAVNDATEWIEEHFKDNPGDGSTFAYPVTHQDAEVWLKEFVDNRLEKFGPYEDAIDSTHSQLFHSVLSPLINCGLLTPQQVLNAVKDLTTDTIPIESLEGFIRQIIGWREYMRATYIRYGTEMRTSNHLKFNTKLPKSWWSGEVGIDPIDTVIKSVLKTAYAHHIERLMILGNSMALLRIDPNDVYEWFMSLFIDAYDWVMVPNVYAMSQFAAGDLITTKPYVSGSNYIIKMSDYKKDAWSATWDALYWQFVNDHRSLLEHNYRSAMMVRLYDRFNDDKKAQIQTTAGRWL
jgi:deoxyribodipyrimidine photolyase-related protein